MDVLAAKRTASALEGMVHYLVDSADGSLGVLDGWERDDHGRPSALVVAQGWFGRRRFAIPVDSVLGFDDLRRRILVARGAAPLERRGLVGTALDLDAPAAAEEARNGSTPYVEASRPVLCGIAEDDHAPAVVGVASRLAASLGAPLVIVHVTPGGHPPGVSAAPGGLARLRDAEARDGNHVIDAVLARAEEPIEAGRIVVPGPVAETLERLARSEHARCVVIGSTGKGALASSLRGSVSHHLAISAPCPVVVVPPSVAELDIAL